MLPTTLYHQSGVRPHLVEHLDIELGTEVEVADEEEEEESPSSDEGHSSDRNFRPLSDEDSSSSSSSSDDDGKSCLNLPEDHAVMCVTSRKFVVFEEQLFALLRHSR